MKASFVTLALSALSCVSAAPLAKRQMTDIDVTILQYALTLEHLENTFYSEGLAKYDASAFKNAGVDSSVRNRIEQIGQDEMSHVSFLETALNASGTSPTMACKYNFGYTDVKSFLATAQILEGVGVSAYLGAAALITEPDYLTAAGSILTVEARHSSYIRNVNGLSGFPAPYDIPLDFNQVYSLAALFITSCPESNPALPVMAFPALAAKMTDSDMVKLTPANSSVLDNSQQLYAAFISYPGATQYGEYNKETMTVTIPKSASGQTYIVLTTSNTSVTDDNTVAGPAILEVKASSSH